MIFGNQIYSKYWQVYLIGYISGVNVVYKNKCKENFS